MNKRIITIFLAILVAAAFVAETGCGFGSKKHAKSSRRRSRAVASSPHFIWPLDNGTYMSGFGVRHGRRHDGIDLAAKSGTPIKAAADGEVVFSKRMRGYGRLILIKHKDNFFTAYAHNRENLVNKGKKVKQGQVIAKVGRSGRATGNHVHFEVRKGQQAVDPLNFLPARAGMIAKRKPLPPAKKTKVAQRERRAREKEIVMGGGVPAKNTVKKDAPKQAVQLAVHDPNESKEIANLIENEIPDVLPEEYQVRMQQRKIALKQKKKKN
jgi:cytochrome c-type biogenesis protein CcmE